jgi:hypothetical protein
LNEVAGNDLEKALKLPENGNISDALKKSVHPVS